MNTRALTLAISLLGTAAMGVALTGTTGCGLLFSGCGDWMEPRSLEFDVDVDLHAVATTEEVLDDRIYQGVAVGAEGTVVAWGYLDIGDEFVEVTSAGTANLRALSVQDDSWWVVGDAGAAAVSDDQGQTWTPVALPTTADVHAIVRFGSQVVIAGDDVVLVQTAGGTWHEIAAPDGEWGQLRALHYQSDRIYAVGLGGVIWSTTDPSGEWVAESSGTQSDLFAIAGISHKSGYTVLAVGASGMVLLRKSGEWQRVDNDESVDLVSYFEGHALGANGELFEVDARAKLSHVDTLPGSRAIAESWAGAYAVGDEGAGFVMERTICEGRPFIVDGRPHTASLHGVDGGSDDTLAEAWADDGLYEHASVASFARFALELLALGAPPRLIRDVQAAVADELRHARACFGLAQRFAGVTLGPGPLPLGENALARVGDPIATALGVFEEACINESVAACLAAEAAARSEDAEVRRVLEGIAVDERRHAVAGWAALRWLLDTYGEQVRQPLRARLARLRPAALPRVDAFDDALISFGRLSPLDQAATRNRVVEQLVRPLAHAMLFPEAREQVTA